MSEKVTVEQKKEFIKWFLKRYQMKKQESKWILRYLFSHDEVLNKVHFVEEAHHCPLSMVMSVTESGDVPFRFYRGNDMNSDATKAFHVIKNNTTEEFYIQLNFPNNISVEYLSVLEENPYAPIEISREFEDAETAEQLITHIMKLSETEKRNRLIDEALDTGNKAWFMELTSELVVQL